ncbi:MAG: hypothetical protein K2W96_12105 [Gemmataceae bacterium]|nr:hypothetical protein [Gemmataceae bacterium]
MSERSEWFVAERTRSLAMIHLTRRDDLLVSNGGEGAGLQFIVRIEKEKGRPALRQFGLFLRGSRGPATLAQVEKSLRPTMQSFARLGPFPYPVALFHFMMEDDQGCFAWVAEPEVADGAPRLVLREAPACLPLDRAALDGIVDRVDAWYDAFFSRVAVKAS